MATYKGVNEALTSLEEFLKSRLPEALSGGTVNASVSLIGSTEINQNEKLKPNNLLVYLHRVVVDSHGRNRCFAPRGNGLEPPTPELPVNLHFLLIAAGASATIEADLLSWGMVTLANYCLLDPGHGDREIMNIVPDEMSNADLMRIWDALDASYTASVPYVARTVRLKLNRPRTEGPAVITRVLPGGTS